MKFAPSILLVLSLAGPAAAGELDFDFGMQATATAWPDDYGAGPTLAGTYWFADWIGATFIGKEQYASVDDRLLSYYSVNGALRHAFGPTRAAFTLGVVHQHEEPRAALMEQPVSSAFGVADGIRHRMASRAGLSLGLPFSQTEHGDFYVAFDLDGTVFADADRGPRWMTSAGLSIGFTYDFARRSH